MDSPSRTFLLSLSSGLMLSLPTTTVSLFFSSPPLPVVLAYMSPSALFVLTEVGWMPTNLPPMRMSHLICVCMHMCVCPSLLCSPFPQSTPSASLSPLSISTLVYVSLQKKNKKKCCLCCAFYEQETEIDSKTYKADKTVSHTSARTYMT